MPVPSWVAATAGQPPLAAQINQLLGTHATTLLYAGSLQASQTTAGSTSTSSNGLWLAQSFTTGSSQTAVGYVSIPLTTSTSSGGSLAPATLALYANSGGAPSGSPLVSTTVTAEYANGASGGTATAFVNYPLPAAVTASTTYWLVVSPSGNGASHFRWYQSNQTTGASTSTNGTSWSAQTYGFEYQVYDQTASGLLQHVWSDAGARWSAYTWNGNGTLATLAEYTAGQTAGSYVQSYRSAAYSSGGLLTGVS